MQNMWLIFLFPNFSDNLYNKNDQICKKLILLNNSDHITVNSPYKVPKFDE